MVTLFHSCLLSMWDQTNILAVLINVQPHSEIPEPQQTPISWDISNPWDVPEHHHNLSSLSWLTMRFPGGQKCTCRPSCPTKMVHQMSLNHWTAFGGQKVSPQLQEELTPLVSYTARAKVLSSWQLPFFFFFWEDTCLGTQCLFSHFSGQSSQPFSLGKLQTVNINHHNSVRSNLPFTWHREDLSGCTVYQLGGLTTHIASCLVYLHYRREWVILQIFQRGGISLIYWSHGYCTPMYHCLKQLHLKIHI